MAIQLIDSYSESNSSTDFILNGAVGSGQKSHIGQSFSNTNSITLDSVKFFLRKNNSPTGNAYALIYSHSGTYGTDSIPTGSPLATSDALDVSTLSGTTKSLITLNFSSTNRITLSSNTKYVAVINFSGGSSLTGVIVGVDTTSPTHEGNYSSSNGGSSWAATVGQDVCFYVYGDTGGDSGGFNIALV